MRVRSWTASAVALVLSLLLTWCSNQNRIAGGSSETQNGTAKLRIYLSDRPLPDTVEHLYVEIHEVQVFSQDLGWITAATLDTVIDVAELSNGGRMALADTLVPAGAYSQLRILFGTGNSLVVNGASHALVLSNDQDSGSTIHLDLTLSAGQAMDVLVDFNATESVQWTLPLPTLDPEPHGYVIADCALLTGGITDQRGSPIASAIVWARAGDSLAVSTGSDSNGQYSLVLRPGSYSVVCSAAGYGSSSPASHAVSVSARDTLKDRNFRMADLVRVDLVLLFGTVADSAGAPIRGATIRAWSANSLAASANSDSTGFYSVLLAAGSYRLTCKAQGYDSATQEIRVEAGSATANHSFLLRLSRIAVVPPSFALIAGTVLDTAGTVLDSVRIQVTNPLGSTYWVLSGKTGAYAIELPAGDVYEVACSTANYLGQARRVELKSADTVLVDFRLLPISRPPVTGLVTGTVRDKKGDPMGFVPIAASIGDSVVAFTFSNAAGQYNFRLKSGDYTIACSTLVYQFSNPAARTVNLVENRDVSAVDFVLYNYVTAPYGLLSGPVRDEQGNAIVGAVITAESWGGTRVRQYTTQSGHYRMILAPGTYHVTCTAKGVEKFEPEARTVVIKEGGEVDDQSFFEED